MSKDRLEANGPSPAVPIPHEVKWTSDQIRRFWDYHAAPSGHEDTYFSKLRGRAIIDFVSSRVPIGRAPDMGCGRGDLIGYLLEAYEALGADQSPESVARVNERFSANTRFRGATVGTQSLEDEVADTVFLIEVVEHLDDHTLSSVLNEARRLLKPKAHLVLTTPNDEDLEASTTICPECASIFHHWQHVRSWTAASLENYTNEFGFVGTATSTLLSPYIGFKKLLQKAAHRLRGERMPHLVYVGRSVP